MGTIFLYICHRKFKFLVHLKFKAMIDLSTKYMGLQLKNPIIVGSSGLTKSVEKIKEFEAKGAGAVVLKSLFEEQILHDSNHLIENSEIYHDYPEAADYFQNITKSSYIDDYLKLIREAKSAVKIPVIASINCISKNEWVSIAKDIEKSGADGLEVNIFFLPYDVTINSAGYEKMYFDIVEKIKSQIKIPIALKIGYYFSGLVNTVQKLSWTGISSLVMFNRFFTADINTDTMKLQTSNIFSSPSELAVPLRWVAILSGDIRCDISATTGIHDADGVIKQLLAGATTTQVCSTIYQNGSDRISEIVEGLTKWMEKKNFKTIADFRGKFSIKKNENPALFFRGQYMKHLFETE
jgi:dihydroorotate dehydrogenase (fumarate)